MFRKTLFAAVLLVQALAATAADYPSKPIKFIVCTRPGARPMRWRA